jgi:hypothetical protein
MSRDVGSPVAHGGLEQARLQSGFAADLSPAVPSYTWSTYTRKPQHLYHTMDRVHPPHVPCVSTLSPSRASSVPPLASFLTHLRTIVSGNTPHRPSIHPWRRPASSSRRRRRSCPSRCPRPRAGPRRSVGGEFCPRSAVGSLACSASLPFGLLPPPPRLRFDSVEFRGVGVGFAGVG